MVEEEVAAAAGEAVETLDEEGVKGFLQSLAAPPDEIESI